MEEDFRNIKDNRWNKIEGNGKKKILDFSLLALLTKKHGVETHCPRTYQYIKRKCN